MISGESSNRSRSSSLKLLRNSDKGVEPPMGACAGLGGATAAAFVEVELGAVFPLLGAVAIAELLPVWARGRVRFGPVERKERVLVGGAAMIGSCGCVIISRIVELP